MEEELKDASEEEIETIKNTIKLFKNQEYGNIERIEPKILEEIRQSY